MDFKVNANQFVKVKLTDYGVDILKKRHDELNDYVRERGGKGIGEFELKLDEKGYYQTQLWILMRVFGPAMNAGLNQPFDLDIIIQNDW